MNLAKTFSKVGRIIKKNLPTILSAVAVIGVAGTAYLAVKETPKAEKEEKIFKKALAYAPAIGAGVATCACIIGSDRMHVVREAGMMLSYNALARNVNAKNAGKIVGSAGGVTALEMLNKKNDEDAKLEWFYDSFASDRLGTPVFYQATWKDVLMAYIYAQDKYSTLGFVSARNYYEELLRTVKTEEIEDVVDTLSDVFGWEYLKMIDGSCYVSLPFTFYENNRVTPEGEPCNEIYFEMLPEYEEF